VFSFFQLSLPKPCMQFSSLPYMPHSTLLSSVWLWV
jgi:hypothetical protein